MEGWETNIEKWLSMKTTFYQI